MSDLIDRQTAVNAILSLTKFNSLRDLYERAQEQREKTLSGGWTGGINDAIDAVMALPSAQPEVRTQMSSADCIRRQAAIDAINSHFGFNIEEEYGSAVQEVINGLPSAQPEQRWIPVSERPPKEGQDVLITKEAFKIKGYEQEVIKAKRSADPRSGKIEWWSEFGTLTDKAVLAWMPLPEPYREEGDE